MKLFFALFALAVARLAVAMECDGTHKCDPGTTCCMTVSGKQGCCPFPQAVCCLDGEHCCRNAMSCLHPSNTDKCYRIDRGQLDLITSKSSFDQSLFWKSEKVEDVRCDATYACSSGQTCCKLTSGQWGCCPLPQAVCCSDHIHCCPHGTTCDGASGICTQGPITLPWLKKQPAIVKTRLKEPEKVEDVQCDATHACPNGETCCKLPSGQWGCCPLPQAVCCSDHIHCCPHDTTCDVAAGTCKQGPITLPWLKKQPAIVKTLPQEPEKVEYVQCDATHACPDAQTCCKLPSGQWGCCPLPQAVCCSDHIHCCPHGATCDVAAGRCDQGPITLPLLKKQPAIVKTRPQEPEKVEDVQCDATYACPSGQTCCKLTSGQWGCCPMPQAVCCSDHIHCCPHGTTCDVAAGTCEQGPITLPWLKKQPAIVKTLPQEPEKVEDVRCDATHACPSGQTCCKLTSGQWGCCPLPQAVCCLDHIHCCPHGTTCDVATGSCNKGLITLPWLKKQSAIVKTLPQEPEKVEDVQCDATHACPSGQTCCKLPSGQWGCCPLPQAVCCSDRIHCCPHGTTCDVAAGTCDQGPISLSWLKKQPAIVKTLPQEPEKVEDVQCDATHACPDAQTCCKMTSGQWGCCPMPQAVCCSDHIHCCPQGYTCDLAAGSCEKGSTILPWMTKQSTIVKTLPQEKAENVKCDATHECPPMTTCCKLASGNWGCCPQPQGVCCSDHIHCCPHNTKCDLSAGTCIQADGIALPWLQKQPVIEKALSQP